MTVSVLVLSRYGAMGASSRLRLFQYLPALANAGIQGSIYPLFSDAALMTRYQHGRYELALAAQCFWRRIVVMWQRERFDLIWIEKEALPWWPLWTETALLGGVPFVLDYDDAVFHNYDQHRFAVARHIFGKRLDGLMAKAALVVAGNDYLATRARMADSPRVAIVPTVIDLARYPAPVSNPERLAGQIPRVVWIGSPSTVPYLQLLQEPLQVLAQRVPFVLRVIGGNLSLPGVNVECVPWSEDAEVEAIAACDVGVMPLLDSPWERGKCGYKLIQYMACGLPVVASAVGVNSEIVRQGKSGYLASTPDDWVVALETLLRSPSQRAQWGATGRQLVEERYCIQKTGPLMAQLLRTAAGKL